MPPVVLLVALAIACTRPPSGEDTDIGDPHDTGAPVDTSDSGDPWSPAESLQELFRRVLGGTVDPRDRPALEDFVADAAEADGPWLHTIRTATSEDGLTWVEDAATVWERASVPEAVVAPDGRIFLYAVDGDLDRFLERALANDSVFRERGLVGVTGLSLRISTDGVAFGPEEPLVVGGHTGVVVDPDVVLREDGTWDLLYVGGRPGPFVEDVVPPDEDPFTWPQVARGADGVRFASHAVGEAGFRFLDPTHLEMDDGSWWMVWNGLWTARSVDDERTWILSGKREWLEGMAPDCVRYEEEPWVYFQCPGGLKLCLARYDAKGEWKLEPGALLERGRAPSVVHLPDGTWRMYFVDDGSGG
ncbi:MAG: hypothetical protein JXB39_08065 [Deltaproteobacteria bacterium]|nr:hypothetical protein [Deltaproteobacteria bacterium]